MKRCIAWMLLACLLLAALPALAAEKYLGNMVVTNCDEWVSLREKPKQNARRVLKVSLGAIVRNCTAHSREWIYAEYDGHAGYILSKYLESCEGEQTHSAMVVAGCPDGLGLYMPIDAQTTDVVIPNGAIVRNCSIQNETQVYVEYAGQCGFVDAAFVRPYNDFGTRWNYPQPMLITTDFSETDDGHMLQVRAGWARTNEDQLVFTSRWGVTDFQVLALSFADMDDYGYMTLEVIHMQEKLDGDHPAVVEHTFMGSMPDCAVSYVDADGVTRFYTLEISGRDGSLVFRPM